MGTLKSNVLPDPGQLTAAFCRYLNREIVEENGVFLLPDPYETEYSENYGCACAAVAYAGAMHRDKSPELRRNYRRMLDRTLQLAADGTVAPFCRTFLAHFAAMSLLMLPETERREQGEGPIRFLLDFEDPCPMIVVNCAAMQLSTQIFLHALSRKPVPLEKAERFLSFIRAARCPSGFINDSVGEERGVWDFMPIAYHGFITFLLSTGLVFGRRFGVLPPECDAAMAGLIRDLAAKFAASPDAQLTVLSAAKDVPALEAALRSALADSFRSRPKLFASPEIKGGMEVSFKNGEVYFDFTSDAITELVAEYIGPRLAKLLADGK